MLVGAQEPAAPAARKCSGRRRALALAGEGRRTSEPGVNRAPLVGPRAWCRPQRPPFHALTPRLPSVDGAWAGRFGAQGNGSCSQAPGLPDPALSGYTRHGQAEGRSPGCAGQRHVSAVTKWPLMGVKRLPSPSFHQTVTPTTTSHTVPSPSPRPFNCGIPSLTLTARLVRL